jgi:type I restriction enzyme S subunit
MNAELLLEQYEHIAEAPDAIARLRRFVLDLAVRGKLVEQDPKDQPASQLLRTFHAERKVRVANKEIRNSKVPDDLERHPFDIPESWIWLPLGETGNIFSGNSINESVRERLSKTENGYPFIATKDVGYGLAALNYDNGLLVHETDATFKVARPNTPFICSEGGSAGRKIGLCDRAVCFGNKLIANEPWSKVSPKYVLYVYLSSFFYEEFRMRMAGIIGGISLNRFVELPFPLPPFGEQQRIVAKVDELMALCDQLETTQVDREMGRGKLTLSTFAKLNEPDPETFANDASFALEHLEPLTKRTDQIKQIRQTILNLAVRGKLVKQSADDEPAALLMGELAKARSENKQSTVGNMADVPFTPPSGWVWASIRDTLESSRDISYGVIKLGPEPKSGGIPTLRCSDVRPGYIDLSGVRTVDPSIESDYARTRLQGGEILINIRGTLGGVAHVPMALRGYNVAREVAVIPVSERLSSQFMVYLLLSSFFWNMIEENLRGIAYKGLNLGILRQFPIPIPPSAEQQRIVTTVDELMALCDQLETSLVEGEQTRSKLLEAMLYEALEPV